MLNRARDLSINLAQPERNESIFQALLLAATRISDLYMLLGNEAYVDAQDPTIGIGTSRVSYGELAPTVWAFQNQEASLIHEELALLRGTDFGKGFPVQNRLFWNFIKGQGEAAYATNYIIKDVNLDGFINESDAKIQYPQGHGDGWGHYLSAQKSQFDLLQHPLFEWEARKELYNLLDIVIEADYLDEIKFARSAVAKAKAGAEIVDLTYRERYIEDPDGQWQGYTDSDPARAWGVSGWGTRAGQGALFDFYVANGLLPVDADDPDAPGEGTGENLDDIDRNSVREIAELAALGRKIQATIDESGDGSNPLGFDQDAIVFDINPTNLDRLFAATKTHYQQIAERAGKAAANAIAAFDYANSLDRRLRQIEQSTGTLRTQADEQDRSFRNRLIQIYGTPYEGLIGPGGAYPEGYEGPDLLFPQYIDHNSADHYNPDPASTYFDVFDTDTREPYQIDAFQRFAFLLYGVPRRKFDGNYHLSEFFDEFTELSLGDIPDDPTSESGEDFYERFSGSGDINILQTDSGDVITLPFPALKSTNYGFRANANWGQRRSYGEVQQKLLQIVQAQIALNKSVDDYQSYTRDLHLSVHELQADRQSFAKNLQVQHRSMVINSLLRVADVSYQIYADVINGTKEKIEIATNSTVVSVPEAAGFTVDPSGPVQALALVSGGTVSEGLDTTTKIAKFASIIASAAADTAAEIGAINAMAREYKGLSP